MAKLLLNRGADANSSSESGLRPMHMAAQEDKVAVANTLTKSGAETDAETLVQINGSMIFE